MNLENARTYLSRVVPWDINSHVVIEWTFSKPNFKRPLHGMRACSSIDDALNVIRWVKKLPDTKDVYVCMSSQKEFELATTVNGRQYKKGIRAQGNAVALRSLFLDVDIKDSGYACTRDAYRALQTFITNAGLPHPNVIVGSGSGGFHVYWTFSIPLLVTEWKPLAQALVEAARRCGFKCDTGVTVDSARILRVPDTTNSKVSKPVVLGPVLPYDYTPEEVQEALRPYMGAQVIQLSARAQTGKTNLNAELSDGISSSPPVDLDIAAAAGCGFLRDAITSGGKDYANPLWNLTTLCSVFSVGGRTDAHRMASGHKDYSIQETDELFDRKVKEHEEKNLGWPSCQSVENAGCTSCTACPLKGPNTKPLQFGRVIAASPSVPTPGTVVDTDLPHSYLRDTNGLIYKIQTNADNTTERKLVCSYAMFTGWIQREPWSFHFSTKLPTSKSDRQISITMEDVNSQVAFAKVMGAQGIALAQETKNTREFIVAWINKLKQVKENIVTAEPFGWVFENNKVKGFAFGGRVWGPQADQATSTPDPEVGRIYTPRGSIDVWKKAATLVVDMNSPERNAYLAASFAAPLVYFTGQRGMLLSTYSTESGAGKSTAIKVAQAIWGDPTRGVAGVTDTVMSVLNRIGRIRHLPAMWDELKTAEQSMAFVELTFQLTGGREKSRLTSDAQLKAMGEWRTLLTVASNASLIDYIVRKTKDTTAGLYRIFEYSVPEVNNTITTAEADQIMLPLDHNNGVVGLEYAKFLGANHERIHKEVASMADAIQKKLLATKEERLWMQTITVLLMGARYCNELGFVHIDEKQLFAFLIQTLKKMRGELQTQPVDMNNPDVLINILQQYVAAQSARNLLRTDKMHVGKGKPPSGAIMVLNHKPEKIDEVVIHYAQNDKKMRIRATHFRTWIAAQGFSPHTIIESLKYKFKMKEVHGRMASGTPFSLFTEYMFQLDLDRSEISHLFD